MTEVPPAAANLARARVTYSSSDPSVASVNSSGLVRAVKDGVATIRVNVNGVTGTAVIVVQGTLTNSTPAVVPAGQPSTVSATFTNGGGSPVSNVALSATVPSDRDFEDDGLSTIIGARGLTAASETCLAAQ